MLPRANATTTVESQLAKNVSGKKNRVKPGGAMLRRSSLGQLRQEAQQRC